MSFINREVLTLAISAMSTLHHSNFEHKSQEYFRVVLGALDPLFLACKKF